MKPSRILLVLAAGCGAPRTPGARSLSSPPSIDRFSASAGHLMVRSPQNRLPGPDQPIDLEKPPFLTQGFGPDGGIVRYYNFDVQPDEPARRYRFTHAGTHAALAGQPDIIDMIPGQAGYNDFWQLEWVEVPNDFAVGSVSSLAQISERGYKIVGDPQILDCPVVPKGTAVRAGQHVAAPVVTDLLYRGVHVECLAFGDSLVSDNGKVPTSPIYVTFAGGTPASGFQSEGAAAGIPQTHNVVFSIPGDTDYSPLWAVHIYDRAAFDSVHDANGASNAKLVNPNGPHVNCPVIDVVPKAN